LASQDSKARRYLVTGASGFIGSHLVRYLLDQGHSVNGFVRRDSAIWRIDSLLPELTLWYGDLTDYVSVHECVRQVRPEVLVHLGGGSLGRPWNTNFADLSASIDVNVHGTLHLLKAVVQTNAPLRRFIRSGGLLEYGNGPIPFKESQREQPQSVYPATQVATTMILNALCSNFKFPVLTLRFASVYGPARALDFFVPSMIASALSGQIFDITSGEQAWDMVYVDDVIEAIHKAVSSEVESGDVINIGSGEGLAIKDIAQMIVAQIDPQARVRIGALPGGKGSISSLVCDIAKARRVLGWQPRTSLQAGLAKTISWYRDNLDIMTQQAGK